MNYETKVQKAIEKLCNSFASGIQVYRNNVGRIKNVSFGLKPGSADLIGWKTIRITPNMVGKHAAVFLSIEVKAPGERIEPGSKQDDWRDEVIKAGGIAIEADSIESARKKLRI